MSQQNPTENTTRWWEFYTVRYAMGTTIGAILFYALCQNDDFLKPLLTIIPATVTNAPDAAKTFGISDFALLGTYGLVFCYIASAPILVFHAGRFLLGNGKSWCTTWKWAIAAIAVSIISACFLFRNDILLSSFALSLLAITLLSQTRVARKAVRRKGDLYKFYKELSEKREKQKGEIVESYRHLREHGNSFFIVFFEFILAFILYSAHALIKVPAIYGIIIFVWILPAVSVWLIATMFEAQFIKNS